MHSYSLSSQKRVRISVVEFYLKLHEYFSSLCSLQRCPPRLQRPWRWKVRITNLGWWNWLSTIPLTLVVATGKHIFDHQSYWHSWHCWDCHVNFHYKKVQQASYGQNFVMIASFNLDWCKLLYPQNFNHGQKNHCFNGCCTTLHNKAKTYSQIFIYMQTVLPQFTTKIQIY